MVLFVNTTVVPFAVLVNAAAGVVETVIISPKEDEAEPTVFVTVSDAPYKPGVLYTTTGFCRVELDGVPPGNSQLYDTTFAEEVLVY